MQPLERSMIRLERGIARACEPAGQRLIDIDVELPQMQGRPVRARAHELLTGPVAAGATVTIALDPSPRGQVAPLALVVQTGDHPDPPGPAALAGMPVVVTASSGPERAAAAARAAGADDVGELAEATLGFWERMLGACAREPVPELLVVAARNPSGAGTIAGDVIEGLALLDARPVAALAIEEVGGSLHVARQSLDTLRDRRLKGVHIAVPGLTDRRDRTALWDELRDERLEERHQLVEVDASVLPGGSPLAAEELGPTAAGILAGRMAVAGRRWRPPS